LSYQTQIYKYEFGFSIYHNDLCRNNSAINLKKLPRGYYHELVELVKKMKWDSSTTVFG